MLSDIVNDRLGELRRRSFSDLAQLPACERKKVMIGEKMVTVTVWKDAIDDDELRIVVQAYRRRILGIGTIDAKGFRIKKSGDRIDLQEPEIFEFR